MNAENSRRDPYVVGGAIQNQERFFGRESLFTSIRDFLLDSAKVLLLHGQRRIGKTSVLRQIKTRFSREEHAAFVYFDLQDKSGFPLNVIIFSLAESILEQLHLTDNIKLSVPFPSDQSSFVHFLAEIEQHIGDKKLVLLLDEFDVLNENVGHQSDTEKSFFNYLKELIEQQENLLVIPVLGRKPNDLDNLQSLFKEARSYKVGLLDETSNRILVERPAKGLLTYSPEAINAIFEQTSGHPYLTQALCSALFEKAREKNHWQVETQDVLAVLDKAIQVAEGGLAWYWSGLPVFEQVMFAAVAEAQARQTFDPLALLKEYGILDDKRFEQSRKKLIEMEYLKESGREVRIELVRRWLLKNYPLEHEILSLAELDDDATNLYEIARNREIEKGINSAVSLYEEVCKINPYHFPSLFRVGEFYLEQQDFGKAAERLELAYRVRPHIYQDSYVQSLIGNSRQLKQTKDLVLAEVQCSKALAIDPNNPEGNALSKEIQSLKERQGFQSFRKWILLAALIAVPSLLAGGIIIGYRLAIREPFTERSCTLTDSTLLISCGGRSLFNSQRENSQIAERLGLTKDNNLNQGIEAVKRKDLTLAGILFQRAITSNRRDPESLIYVNNVLAQQQGNPITLAVVVPITQNPENAITMLRGVAQAQDEFNRRRKDKGRMLQIVIASDDSSNDSKPASRSASIAQELVIDQSVLGVIGHNTSESSLIALRVYADAGVPMISPTSSSNALSVQEGNSTFFRTIPSDSTTAQNLAKHVIDRQVRRVTVAYSKGENYSDSISSAYTEEFKTYGGSVIERFDIRASEFDPAQVVRAAISNGSQAIVLLPAATDRTKATAIAQANAAVGNQLKLFGSSSLYSQEMLDSGGRAVEGMTLIVPWFSDPTLPFARSARNQWGGDVGWRTAASFDATQAFLEAIKDEANPTRETVLKNLKDITLPDSNTASNRQQSFTDRNEYTGSNVFVTVRQRRFVLP